MTGVFSGSWRRTAALAVLLGFVPLAGGCFGSFHLTRKVYNFNKSATPNKWVRWCLFMGMNIIPVYWFAAIGDIVFANAVEFWTGSNPITVQLQPQQVVTPAGVVQLIPVDGGARIVVTETNGAVHEMTLLREAPGVVAVYDRDGTLVRRVSGLDTDEPEIFEFATAS